MNIIAKSVWKAITPAEKKLFHALFWEQTLTYVEGKADQNLSSQIGGAELDTVFPGIMQNEHNLTNTEEGGTCFYIVWYVIIVRLSRKTRTLW